MFKHKKNKKVKKKQK